MECKSMATSMVTNLKKMSDSTSYSNLADPTMYKKSIGSLMYLLNTKPYNCFAVSTLSQFMVELRHVHWVAVKHVLQYLRATIGYGLRYVSDGEVRMQSYIGSDWVGSAVHIKSTSKCCFSLESTMISWSRKKQTLVTLNTEKAEYIVTSSTTQEVVWLQKLLAELFDQTLEMTFIYCDNQSCVKVSDNPIFHDNSKHIEIKDHFI